MSDSLLELAKQQGYVPKECEMDGGLVMALINDGQKPCTGCNNSGCVHSKINKEEVTNNG